MSSLLDKWNSKSKKILDDKNNRINNQDETKQENIKSPDVIDIGNESQLLSFSQVSNVSGKNLNNSIIDEVDHIFTQESTKRYSKDFATKEDFTNHVKKQRLLCQDPPLYRTELPDPSIIELKLNMLVWAPYYKLKNTYWCARLLVGQTEIRKTKDITEPYPWELEGKNQEVVEFLCSIHDSSTTTRLLKVEKSKIKPFYGDEFIDKIEDISRWDNNLMRKLEKGIQSYYNKTGVADRIFTEIRNKANEFIQEALKNDDPSMYLQYIKMISKRNDTKNNITNISNSKNNNNSSKKESAHIYKNSKNKQLIKVSNDKTKVSKKKRKLRNTTEHHSIILPRKSGRIK